MAGKEECAEGAHAAEYESVIEKVELRVTKCYGENLTR